MSPTRTFYLLLGFWLSAFPAIGKADMTLLLDNLLARPGETVLLGAYATSNTADVISGFKPSDRFQ